MTGMTHLCKKKIKKTKTFQETQLTSDINYLKHSQTQKFSSRSLHILYPVQAHFGGSMEQVRPKVVVTAHSLLFVSKILARLGQEERKDGSTTKIDCLEMCSDIYF